MKTSNWLRFVNCPRKEVERNVNQFNCKGKVHYMVTKDVYPGQELLIYYGDEYARYLGIDVGAFHSSTL